ncbi:MAG: portal protein [Geminicoccaceae bacterium]
MGELSHEAILSRYQAAQSRRRPWESLWRDCYAFALPQRGSGFGSRFDPARRHSENLFDGTASDAVEQLAASLLAELTPPWSQWFGLVPGCEVTEFERPHVSEELDKATQTLQGHFDRSNFAVEIHQAFLDLATVGAATLLFEEAPLGALSAFRLTAVPMSEMFFESGPDDQILGHFRSRNLPHQKLKALFPDAELPSQKDRHSTEGSQQSLPIVEAVLPCNSGFEYTALLVDQLNNPTLLAQGLLPTSPFISFRWLKGASEIYGRSPVMTALPDIKTVNKVVELVLKNASIAVTGIWQADDDGVLNAANKRSQLDN